MRIFASLALVALTLPRLLLAQADTSLARAFDLERRGAFAAAAEGYRAALARDPGNVVALLGLERSLVPLGREGEIGPLLGPILARRPGPEVYAIALRAWVAAGREDSARRVVELWARAGGDPALPYRQWGDLLLVRHNAALARGAYLLGRAASGDSAGFALEIARAATLAGDRIGAAPEWVRTTRTYPMMRLAAVAALSDAPSDERGAILRAVDAAGTGGRPLGTLLLAAWGKGEEAVARVDSAVAAGSSEQGLLEALVGELRGAASSSGPGARRALGRALELLAGRRSPQVAAPLRLESARAYADAGDREAARRMLTSILDDPAAAASLGRGTVSVVIGVLIAEGDLAEAERRLTPPPAELTTREVRELRRRLALGWAWAGDLDRAQRLLVADSSVETAAVQGRLFLYRGELAEARRAFKWAGPFAGDRAEATARVGWLALLQAISADTSVSLGTGVMALDRGDTAAAVAAFGPLAERLPAAKGGGEVTLLLGRLELAQGRDSAGVAWIRRAIADSVATASPAAGLVLAQHLARRGRTAEAVATLEQVILAWPASAVVPEARRFLEELRSAGPGGTA